VSGTFRLNASLVYVSLAADAFVGAYTDITYTFNTSLDVMAVIFQVATFLFTAGPDTS
jgi:hypothetical protein